MMQVTYVTPAVLAPRGTFAAQTAQTAQTALTAQPARAARAARAARIAPITPVAPVAPVALGYTVGTNAVLNRVRSFGARYFP